MVLGTAKEATGLAFRRTDAVARNIHDDAKLHQVATQVLAAVVWYFSANDCLLF